MRKSRRAALALLAFACVGILVATSIAPTAGSQVASGVRVPRVKGKRLDIAEARLHIAALRWKEHGGGLFGIVVKHNWQVCLQVPRAGKVVPRRTRVQLYVSRPGEC